MSEPMALERLVEQWLRFDGYWTLTRVPFKILRRGGGNSDFDVLGVNAKGKVVVAECKAWGRANDYWDFDAKSDRRVIEKLCKKVKKDWPHFKQSYANKRRLKLRRIDTPRLVLPGRLSDPGTKEELESSLTKRCGFDVQIFGIHEVIQKIQDEVEKDKDKRRRRYADTALEMIRWILRSDGRICWKRH